MYYHKEVHLLSTLFVVINWLLGLCQTQTSSFSDYSRSFNPSFSNLNSKHLVQHTAYPYSTGSNTYKQPAISRATQAPYNQATFGVSNRKSTPSRRFYSNFNPSYTPSYSKQYASSPFNTDYAKNVRSNKGGSSNKKRASKMDEENAKFAGAENQENDDDGRTIFLKRKKFHRRFGGAQVNPCYPYGRDAGKTITPPPKAQGRFLWDVNVYNVYPQTSVGLGCGHYGGFGAGFGGGLLSDPVSSDYYPPGTGIANFLNLLAPGILQNSLAVTSRPQQFADYGPLPTQDELQNDPEVDPNYRPGPASVPVRRPNQVFYDSAGAPPLPIGHIVGGVSSTVNGIIQQLTGNVRPVYR